MMGKKKRGQDKAIATPPLERTLDVLETQSAAAEQRFREEVRRVPSPTAASLIAKKDFIIRQEPYERIIRAGDDLANVPEKYHPNLRTEGVL
jgi:hypothetical protein